MVYKKDATNEFTVKAPPARPFSYRFVLHSYTAMPPATPTARQIAKRIAASISLQRLIDAQTRAAGAPAQ